MKKKGNSSDCIIIFFGVSYWGNYLYVFAVLEKNFPKRLALKALIELYVCFSFENAFLPCWLGLFPFCCFFCEGVDHVLNGQPRLLEGKKKQLPFLGESAYPFLDSWEIT